MRRSLVEISYESYIYGLLAWNRRTDGWLDCRFFPRYYYARVDDGTLIQSKVPMFEAVGFPVRLIVICFLLALDAPRFVL